MILRVKIYHRSLICVHAKYHWPRLSVQRKRRYPRACTAVYICVYIRVQMFVACAYTTRMFHSKAIKAKRNFRNPEAYTYVQTQACTFTSLISISTKSEKLPQNAAYIPQPHCCFRLSPVPPRLKEIRQSLSPPLSLLR